MDQAGNYGYFRNAKTKQWVIYITLYTITILNFISMSLFSPPINRQLRVLEISPFVLGVIGSVYGATNLLSSPFIGVGCDRYGVSLVFVLALMGTALNNCAQVFTTSLAIFVLARSSAGFLKHTATLGKMLLAQFTKRNELAWGLGYLGAFSHLGVVIGPSLGAYLIQLEDGLSLVLWVALGMNAIMILLTAKLLWVPASMELPDANQNAYKKTDETSASGSDSGHSASIEGKSPPKSHVSNLKLFLRLEWQLIFIFALKFCFTFASQCIRSNFPMIMQRKYFATESAIGYLNSVQSVTAMLVGFGVSPVIYYVYRNDVRKVTLHAGTLQMISFICQILSPTFFWSSISYLLLDISNPFLWVSTIALALEYKSPTTLWSQDGDKNPGQQHQISTSTILSLSTTFANISCMLAPICAGSINLPTDGALLDENDGPSLVSACFACAGVLITLVLLPASGDSENSKNSSNSNLKLKQG